MNENLLTVSGVYDGFPFEANSPDGKVWRWAKSRRVVDPYAAEERAIPCDFAAQETAYRTEIRNMLTAAETNTPEPVTDTVEMMNLQAHFPKGTKVVNALSGRVVIVP
jgi:hypothetical protein